MLSLMYIPNMYVTPTTIPKRDATDASLTIWICLCSINVDSIAMLANNVIKTIATTPNKTTSGPSDDKLD